MTSQCARSPIASGSHVTTQADPLPMFDASSSHDVGPSNSSFPVTPASLKSQASSKPHPHAKQKLKDPKPHPRSRWASAEGLGFDHSRSLACGILGIGATPFNKWSMSKHARARIPMPGNSNNDAGSHCLYDEVIQQEIKSEELRRMIERRIQKWEEKYPERVRMRYAVPYILGAPALLEFILESGMTYMAAIEFWADVLSPVQPPPNPLCPPLGQYHPPSGALGSAMPLPHPLLPIGFDYIDAHIAAVTARGVSANHGPAQYVGTVATMQRQPARSTLPPHMGYGHLGDCTSMCMSNDPVIRFVSQLSFSICAYMF